jgi:hypothetical protein
MGKRVKGDMLTYQNPTFPSLSHVAKEYQVTNGVLQRVGRGFTRSYQPFYEAGLPDALARISEDAELEDVKLLEFASKFGELGYSQIVRSTLFPSFPRDLSKSPDWKDAHDAFENYVYVLSKGHGQIPEGDPVRWVKAHSRTVALCLNFIGLLNIGDEDEIRDELESVPRGPYAVRDQIVPLPVKEWRAHLEEGRLRPSIIIRHPVCNLITENIAGVRRRLITDPLGSRSESFFFPAATIEAVYWQLADKMEVKMIQRCAECRRFFIARDKRQHYCPPLPGSTRSRCSSKLNVRNFRIRPPV